MFEELDGFEQLSLVRTNDLSESTDLYYNFVNWLKSKARVEYNTRADFILKQLNGEDGTLLFEMHRESWGIPKFDEYILTVNDFRRGFLWQFRDHTTSWNDNQLAKTWFLTSPESIFVRRYEFWSYDKGFEECIEVRNGSYKEILKSLLDDGDFEVLESPAFSKKELLLFIRTYKAKDGDYEIDEIIEDHIINNPNYSS